jgi:UDP-3-O-[3-hydroxymyristoyl] glucosamine N-acyltransferase
MPARTGPQARWRGDKEWDAQSVVSDLEKRYHVEGPSRKIRGVSSVLQAGEGDLAFSAWEGDKGVSCISNSKASIVLCKNSLRGKVSNPDSQLMFLDNPHLVFVRFVNMMCNQGSPDRDSISAHAVIAKSAQVGSNCQIGAFVTIGENCMIGDNAVIGERITLKNCTVGDMCVIQTGVAIGSEGFAYERHPDGIKLERFPHLAGVVIGDSVEISSNCSIAKGSLTDTFIGSGTKLDALVHVAHNVRLGTNYQLAAGTIIGGSTVVGDSCWTGLNSTLKNTIKVGNNVLVGAGTCVISDVPDGEIVAGVPAKSIKQKVTSSELFIMTGKNAA